MNNEILKMSQKKKIDMAESDKNDKLVDFGTIIDANPACLRCNGTGRYMYDHNHGTICGLCCKHGEGFWQLSEHYGRNKGKLCCRIGCGKIKETEDE